MEMRKKVAGTTIELTKATIGRRVKNQVMKSERKTKI